MFSLGLLWRSREQHRHQAVLLCGLLTRSKEAVLTMKKTEIPQIMILSQAVTWWRKGSDVVLHPLGDDSAGAGPRQPGQLVSAGGQLLRVREREERQGEEDSCQIPSSPFPV